MKRVLIEEVLPSDGNGRNRVKVGVYETVTPVGEAFVGVGFSIKTKTRDGSEFWVNVHPGEVDELIRMLQGAKLIAVRKLIELGRDDLLKELGWNK